MKYIVIALLLFTISGIKAQNLSVENIPQILKDQSNVIKRFEKVYFDIIDPTHTVLKKKYALTVLNEQGAKESQFLIGYSKLSSLKSFEGVLYDANGKEIKKLKWKDLIDESAVSTGNLMDDYRIKRYELYHRDYPFTIVYEYEEHNNNSLFLETWQPIEDEKYAVEHSQFTVALPQGVNVRYKAFNYDHEPVKKEEEGKTTLTWEVKNLRAVKKEILSKPLFEFTPRVMAGSENFQIEGYSGSMASWKSFGEFVYKLTENRQELPVKIKQDVHEITKGLESDYEKIAVLYKYLQKNTRYISVQLGIGGWQPFDAAYVAKNSYGDCKALVNYMQSLLKEVGVNSFYTLVRAGASNSKVIVDMPSQQFNHVILCVPVKQDTVWLECTSQTLPVGYLSAFTQNRYALLVDKTGGKLVRTPKYGLAENRQLREIKAHIDDFGNLKASVVTVYEGLQQDDLHDIINYLTKDKIKEYLNKSLPLSTYEVMEFDYTPQEKKLPSIKENLEILASGYVKKTGKRLLIEPNILSKQRSRLPLEERRFPLLLDYPYMDIDSIKINIPNGYLVETMPEETKLQSRFGDYNFKVTLNDGALICYRSFKHNEGEFSANDYKELSAFYETIYKADRKQVILIKEE